MIDLDKFKKIKIKKRTHCVVCGKKMGRPVFKMPDFPLTEIYVEQKIEEKLGFVDQEFHLCDRCGHGQLANVLDPKVLYGSCYKTRTSTSSSAIPAVDIFLSFINNVLKDRKVKTIFEIGCNDLYALQKLKDKAEILYGVDPILKGKEQLFKDKKIKVIGDFFENIDMKALGLKMDVVLSSHTLEHIEDPKQMIQNLMNNSSSDTVLFFQFPGLESLVNDANFDQVFHQHLNYFSLQSVLYMLKEVDAELIDCRVNPYHWGALMIAFRKKTAARSRSNSKLKENVHKVTRDHVLAQYKIFKDYMVLASKRIESLNGEFIYGYGAALMLPVLYYYIGEALLKLKYIIDEDSSKKDLYYLNVPLQIKIPEQIKDIKKSVMLVTAINSMQAKRSITQRLIQLNVKKIIIPNNLI